MNRCTVCNSELDDRKKNCSRCHATLGYILFKGVVIGKSVLIILELILPAFFFLYGLAAQNTLGVWVCYLMLLIGLLGVGQLIMGPKWHKPD